jgi:2-polyprenyl-3-methyl-5-hydroxy-6-metoxy-1,4-benzoquinol methylase
MRNLRANLLDPIWAPDNLQLEEAADTADQATLQRLSHYWWAWRIIESHNYRRIHDIGCGTGYGCKIMSVQHTEHEFHGWDKDNHALTIANDMFSEDQITYRRVNLDEDHSSLIKRGHEPQLITCFHTFEALEHRDLFLYWVTQILADDGMFLCSVVSPNSVTCKSASLQRFMVRIGKQDMKNILSMYFEEVSTVEQKQHGGDILPETKLPEAAYFQKYLTKVENFYEHPGEHVFACSKPRRVL